MCALELIEGEYELLGKCGCGKFIIRTLEDLLVFEVLLVHIKTTKEFDLFIATMRDANVPHNPKICSGCVRDRIVKSRSNRRSGVRAAV